MNGDNFDKIVSKLNTTQLTSNTSKVTELPDNFEPMDSKEVEEIANAIK